VRGTRQRAALAAVLMDLDEFRSAQDLHFELRGRGESVGLTTVYRALQQMACDGLVDKVRTDTGEVMYRWCFRGLHHHLMCRRCEVAVEVQAAPVEQWASQIAREHGFSDITSTIEIAGTCARCAGR
jgi:Fur family transcriptional regulator, ferric uptake regulator